MQEKMYKQCLMKKDLIYQTSWIASKIAVINNVIKLKEDLDWDYNWTIVKVYDTELPWSIVNKNSQNYKTQRKASDI